MPEGDPRPLRLYVAVRAPRPGEKRMTTEPIEAPDAFSALAKARARRREPQLVELRLPDGTLLWEPGMGRSLSRPSRPIAVRRAIPALDRWAAIDHLLAHPDATASIGRGWAAINRDRPYGRSSNDGAENWAAIIAATVLIELVDMGWFSMASRGAFAVLYAPKTRPSGHQILAWTRQRAKEKAALAKKGPK